MPSLTPLHVPSAVGRAALVELDRVPWSRLAHAYGTGPRGDDLDQDVAASLRRLGDDDDEAIDEAACALAANILHQGTIYQGTAYAVPFLVAFAAGVDLTRDHALLFRGLLAGIAIASSYNAPRGSHSGSWGRGVAALTREAFRASAAHLRTMARDAPSLAPVAEALLAYSRTDAPDPAAVARLRALFG